MNELLLRALELNMDTAAVRIWRLLPLPADVTKAQLRTLKKAIEDGERLLAAYALVKGPIV